MSEFGATGTITPSFSITTVLLAFAVSVGIGVIFGFYPRAAPQSSIQSSACAISNAIPLSCGEIGSV